MMMNILAMMMIIRGNRDDHNDDNNDDNHDDNNDNNNDTNDYDDKADDTKYLHLWPTEKNSNSLKSQ